MMQISYLALGSQDNPMYGLLSDRANALFSDLRAHVTAKWKDADSKDKRTLARISGCLEKLSAFLMQVSRMRKYHDALLDLAQKFNQFGDAPLPVAISIAKHGREECSDFEASLLQARAALDRLTWFIADQFQQASSSFSSLENILSDSNKPNAQKLLEIVRQATYLKMSVIGPGNPDPLRDFVAHKGAAWEIMASCFAIYYFGQNRVLVCDCELGDTQAHLAVLRTSYNLCKEVPFVVLNSLAVSCGMENMPHEQFSPNWQQVSVVLSEFLTQEQNGLRLNVTKRMTPSGFESVQRMMNRDILKYLVHVEPGPGSFTLDMGKPQ